MTPEPTPGSGRLARTFARLKQEGRGGLVTFTMAGDPDAETSLELLNGLPGAGADIVELGMPFSDPMADGPVIEAAGLRARKAGTTMRTTLEIVRRFRSANTTTPLVLMGYFNPIYAYGVTRFARDAAEAGADGLIVVDLPPEEDAELRHPAAECGLAVIRLASPTTRGARLSRVLDGAAGFLYYVAVAGITGTHSAPAEDIARALAPIRAQTDLPVVVGFGIKTPGQARDIVRHADAAVVGSALVGRLASGFAPAGAAGADLVADMLAFVGELAAGVRDARSN